MKKLDVVGMEKQLELTEQRLSQEVLVPGVALAEVADRRSGAPGLVGGGSLAQAVMAEHGGRPCLSVPSGGEIMSLFDARAWACVDPRCFPSGVV